MATFHRRSSLSPWFVRCANITALWLLLAGTVGCWQSAPAGGPPAAGTGGEEATADSVLKRMAAVYRKATSYQDAGAVTLRFEQQGQKVNEQFDFSVAFVRPNKLRLDCYGVVLRNDGKQVHGYIKNVEDVAGQVLELDSPAELTIENMVLDMSMQEMLRGGIAQAPPQLVLLMADNATEMILANSKSTILLPSKNYESDPCYRVRVDSEEGSLMLWIDERTFALRRVDFPTTAFQKNLEQNGPVNGLELYAEFTGAKLDAPVPPEAFAFEVPREAKIVKRLLGPAPSPPSKLLGKPAPEFAFTTIDGAKITRDAIKDKIAVFDFWFTQCTPCQQSFPLLNKVYERYKDSDKVVFLTVNADDESLSNQSVRDTAKSWGGTLPLARDPNQDIRKAFEVTGMPAMFVIGADGTVQHHDIGFNPNLERELPETIEALLAGKTTYELAQKRYERRLTEYEAALQMPPEIPTKDGEIVEIPKAKIEPASEPANHRRTKLWANADVKSPGNILVLADAADGVNAAPGILVFDGWDTVVEVRPDGTLGDRHKIDSPDGVIGTLRTATDKNGSRYYAAFLSAQQQLQLLDENWKPLLSFPPTADGKHEGIGDVQFADLDGDGALELAVGYWGDVGLQYVGLDGKRVWTDRSLQYVLRIATAANNESREQRLLCANSRGGLAVFDATGKPGTEITVPGRPMQTVYSADLDGDGRQEYSGLSFRSLGASSLVGFDLEGKELWHYDLPTGVHEKPIEPISVVRLFGNQSQWLVAGADGSIHILAADGKLIDKFHYGAQLAGLAGAQIDGQAVLFIAGEKGLEAWKLEPNGP